MGLPEERVKQGLWLAVIPSVWTMCIAAIARRSIDPIGWTVTFSVISYIGTAVACSVACARHALALSKGSDG